MLASRFRRTVEEHGLLARGDRVLCAISGGPDSTALLHVLASSSAALGIELEAATVDHGLRPEGALEAQQAAAAARALGVRCEVLTLALAPGPGAQERAREARYERLRAHALAVGCGTTAVGHTLDDQAETVVARLLRGAGLRGLAGVLPRREDGVVRPLLDCTRAEVESYLAHHQIGGIVRDPSNGDEAYQRVRVRAHVLPALAAESPEIGRTLAALAEEAREIRTWVSGLGTALVAGQPRDRLDVTRVSALAPPLRTEVLRLWGERLTGAKLGRAHLVALGQVLAGRGEARLPGGLVVRTEGGSLRVTMTSGPSEDAPDGSLEEA